jgi:hypothetical protein
VTDRAAEAAAELYGADPDQFTKRRTELSSAAKAAGDAEAAKRIAALRKPTRVAWLVNRLVREHSEIPAQLAELSDGLRDAAASRDGQRLRELSAERSALVDDLTARALAPVSDPPVALRDDVSATFDAAIADPETAADLAAGTLTRAVHWAGFGAFTPTESTGAAEPPKVTPPKPPAAPLREAEARNRRNQLIQDAERRLANASVIAASAAEEEDRLESVVRELEERVTTARDELSQARLRARRAEAAERKAATALDQLRVTGHSSLSFRACRLSVIGAMVQSEGGFNGQRTRGAGIGTTNRSVPSTSFSA